MGQYLPVVVMGVLAAGFAGLALGISKLLAPKRASDAKEAPFECGIIPTREPPDRFPVSFYLVAMLFIMFDIEIVFLYPYAVAHADLGAFGFGAIMFFSVVFFLSFVYEVGRGGLDWGPVNSARRLVTKQTTSTPTAGVRLVGLDGRNEMDEAA